MFADFQQYEARWVYNNTIWNTSLTNVFLSSKFTNSWVTVIWSLEMKLWNRLFRVLATVNKTIGVNAVFQFWPRVELPNLFPKCLLEHQKLKIVKSKFKIAKTKKRKK